MFKKIKKQYLLIAILVIAAILRLYNIWYPNQYVFDEVYHAFTAKEFLLNHQEAWEWWNTPPPGVAYEWTHPPLAKEIMALSMGILHTQDSWAYRLPGVLFGVLSVYLVYLLTKKILEMFKDKAFAQKAALLAAFAFSLDGLNFVQSRTGMNDIYFVGFMLATMLFFLSKKYFISAVFLGLALASKWTGLYLIGLIFLLLFISFYKEKIVLITSGILGVVAILLFAFAKILAHGETSLLGLNTDSILKFLLNGWTHLVVVILIGIYLWVFPRFRKMGWFLFIPPIIYLATYLPFFFYNHHATPFHSIFEQIGYNYDLFTQLQQQMWWYHSNLKATHDYASAWWSWPFNLYPVWYFVDYHNNDTLSNIFASGNPLMFLMGFFSLATLVWETGKKWLAGINILTIILIFANFLYMAFTVNNPNSQQFDPKVIFAILFFLFGLTVAVASIYYILKKNFLYIPLLGYLIFWLPWALSPRIMFLYHYAPTLPFMTIVLGYKLQTLNQSKQDRILLYLGLAAIIIGFIFVYPVLVGIPLPKPILEFFFHSNLTKNPFG